MDESYAVGESVQVCHVSLMGFINLVLFSWPKGDGQMLTGSLKENKIVIPCLLMHVLGFERIELPGLRLPQLGWYCVVWL